MDRSRLAVQFHKNTLLQKELAKVADLQAKQFVLLEAKTKALESKGGAPSAEALEAAEAQGRATAEAATAELIQSANNQAQQAAAELARNIETQREMHAATLLLRSEIDELKEFSAVERSTWSDTTNTASNATQPVPTVPKDEFDQMKASLEAREEELRSELDLCEVVPRYWCRIFRTYPKFRR